MLKPGTIQDFEQAILDCGNNPTFAGLILVTDPLKSGMRRTNNPWVIGAGKSAVCTIRKVNKVCGRINPNYDSDVRRRVGAAIVRELEAHGIPALDSAELDAAIDQRFRDGESWHRPLLVDGNVTALSYNPNSATGDRYLRFVVQSCGTPEYIDAFGCPVDSAKVQAFMGDKSCAYENQGLAPEETVKFICPLVSSIFSMNLDGQKWLQLPAVCSGNSAMRTTKIAEIADEYLNKIRATSKV